MALFQHRVAGGDAASAPVVAPAAASAASLGAFKNNLSNITQSLASSIPFPRPARAATATGPMSQEAYQQVRPGPLPSPPTLTSLEALSSVYFIRGGAYRTWLRDRGLHPRPLSAPCTDPPCPLCVRAGHAVARRGGRPARALADRILGRLLHRRSGGCQGAHAGRLLKDGQGAAGVERRGSIKLTG